MLITSVSLYFAKYIRVWRRKVTVGTFLVRVKVYAPFSGTSLTVAVAQSFAAAVPVSAEGMTGMGIGMGSTGLGSGVGIRRGIGFNGLI